MVTSIIDAKIYINFVFYMHQGLTVHAFEDIWLNVSLDIIANASDPYYLLNGENVVRE